MDRDFYNKVLVKKGFGADWKHWTGTYIMLGFLSSKSIREGVKGWVCTLDQGVVDCGPILYGCKGNVGI